MSAYKKTLHRGPGFLLAMLHKRKKIDWECVLNSLFHPRIEKNITILHLLCIFFNRHYDPFPPQFLETVEEGFWIL